jgi:hypothetical protein
MINVEMSNGLSTLDMNGIWIISLEVGLLFES